jgi:hypothetical protein
VEVDVITQARLKELFHYDPDTGIFTRLKSVSSRAMAGNIAGTPGSGYLWIGIDGKDYKAHRLVWLYVRGYFPVGVDHHDHNGLNNAFMNLREADQGENMKNKSKYSNNKSGHAGVNWHKLSNKWAASIGCSGKRIHLGVHEDINAAILTRIVAAFAYGFHANHGKNNTAAWSKC